MGADILGGGYKSYANLRGLPVVDAPCLGVECDEESTASCRFLQ